MTVKRKRKRDTSRNLHEEAVGPKTRERYKLALKRFAIFVQFMSLSTLLLFSDAPYTDQCCADFLQYLYTADLPQQWAGDFLSAVQDAYPRLKRNLDLSWRAFGSWRRLEPPQRAKPISSLCLQLLLYHLFTESSSSNFLEILHVAAYVGLIFSALLRPSEIHNLRWSDILLEVIDGNLVISLAIEASKTSVRKFIVEHVIVKDAFLFSLLLVLKTAAAGPQFWPYRPGKFAQSFQIWQAVARLSGFTPYSFRRGGATAHFLKHHNYDYLCNMGRWSSLSAARRYVDDSMSSLVRLKVPPRPNYMRKALRAIMIMLLQHFSIYEQVRDGLESIMLDV